MAPPSKKNSRSSGTGSSKKTIKRKTSRRNTGKKKTARKKKRSGLKKRTGMLLFILIGMISLVGIGYCLGTCWMKEEKAEQSVKKHVVPKKTPKKTIEKRITPVKQKKVPKVEKEVTPTVQKKSYQKSKLAYRGEKPRLAIIIDDVHTQNQLQRIQSLPMPVTPSIFPPYTLAPNTPKLATQAVHYMIHLPMESGNAKFDRQSKTLKRGFSSEQMVRRMAELRRLFPRAHFINNHTGSRFTSDSTAMRRLYRAMKEEGFIFIDSRTTSSSKVGKIAHSFGDDYVARDIFIDNVKSVTAIHNQLKKAVRLAKKNGYAIAIGHPHKITLQALASAKPFLKEVEVVYIDEIFREE